MTPTKQLALLVLCVMCILPFSSPASVNEVERAVDSLAAHVQSMTQAEDEPTDAVNKAKSAMTSYLAEHTEMKRQATHYKSLALEAHSKLRAIFNEKHEIESKYRQSVKDSVTAKTKLADVEHTANAFSSGQLKTELEAAKTKLAQYNAEKPQKEKEKARVQKATSAVSLDFPEKAKTHSHGKLATIKADNEKWFREYEEHKKKVNTLKHNFGSSKKAIEEELATARHDVQNAADHVNKFKVELELVRQRHEAAKNAYRAELTRQKNADEKAAAALFAAKGSYEAVKRAFEARNQAYTRALTTAQTLETKHITKLARRKAAHAKLTSTITDLKQKLTQLTTLIEKEQKKHGDLLNQAKRQEEALLRSKQEVLNARADFAKSRTDASDFATSAAARPPLKPHTD